MGLDDPPGPLQAGETLCAGSHAWAEGGSQDHSSGGRKEAAALEQQLHSRPA